MALRLIPRMNRMTTALAAAKPGINPGLRASAIALAGLLCWGTAGRLASAQVAPTSAQSGAYSGLLRAASTGDAKEIARLTASGADPNVQDAYGRTPLHVATFARRREAISALAKAGANLGALESDRYDAVTIASVADDVDTLRLLLNLGASAKLVTSRYDGTALIAAAHLGHDGVVNLLIGAGAPLDHVNNLGWTAVIESIVLGDGGTRHVATLRALVEAGANVNIPDRTGATPLALARARGYSSMVAILEQVKAPESRRRR